MRSTASVSRRAGLGRSGRSPEPLRARPASCPSGAAAVRCSGLFSGSYWRDRPRYWLICVVPRL